MAGKWTQALREETAKILLNIMDDVRHKLVEQGWSGQEQTGYIQSPYESMTDSAPMARGDTQTPDSWRGQPNDNQATSDTQTEPQSAAVSHETHRPNETAGWWQGEHQGSYGGNEASIIRNNSWSVGQDASATYATQEKSVIDTPPKLEPSQGSWQDFRNAQTENADVYGQAQQHESAQTPSQGNWQDFRDAQTENADVYGQVQQQDNEHDWRANVPSHEDVFEQEQ